jgi:hypothetical protein
MAHLGVAHLAVRQPDRLARRLQRRVRVLGPKAVEDGRLSELDGIAGTGRCEPPPVEDDEGD